MRTSANLTFDFNITATDLEKFGAGDKWLRQKN
jgi:hypothetical protein